VVFWLIKTLLHTCTILNTTGMTHLKNCSEIKNECGCMDRMCVEFVMNI